MQIKKFSITILLLAFLTSCKPQDSPLQDQLSYEQVVSHFISADPIVLSNQQLPQSSLLFVGRASCKYCQEATAELNTLLAYRSDVYYLDT
ncbi:hypothetical protein KMA66_07450, partial [Enterococcus faecalis]